LGHNCRRNQSERSDDRGSHLSSKSPRATGEGAFDFYKLARARNVACADSFDQLQETRSHQVRPVTANRFLRGETRLLRVAGHETREREIAE
jgi:hypothetical protein